MRDRIQDDKTRSMLPHNNHPTIIDYVRRCIANDTLMSFYQSRPWKRLRMEVLTQDKNECQLCKSKGRYTSADHVHHVNHVKKHPELAMSKVYVSGDGAVKRNLISVCTHCHETVCHPKRKQHETPERVPPERWD